MSLPVDTRQPCISEQGKALSLAVFTVFGMTAMPSVAELIAELVSNACLAELGPNAAGVAAICAKRAYDVKVHVGIGGLIVLPTLWAVMTAACWCPRKTSVLSSSEA